MKNIFYDTHIVYCILVLSLYLIGCEKPEDVITAPVSPEVPMLDQTSVYPYERKKIVHLSKDTVYILSHMFTRESGEELIIDPGTLIKVNTTGSSGGTVEAGIIIRAGGNIQAAGTRGAPIVFTSNEYPGTQGRNWSGLVVQGKASENSLNPSGDDNDFSGTLSYVRIEFASIQLTGVGSRTTIQNVEVSYSRNSSFELNGGSFNTINLVSYACGGPTDFYITRGYTGKMQNIMALRHPFFGSGKNTAINAFGGMLIENHPDSTTATIAMPVTFPVISNLSLLGPDGQNGSTVAYTDTSIATAALITTRSAKFTIRNSVFAGFLTGGLYLGDSQIAANLLDNISEFKNCVVQSSNADRTFVLAPGVFSSYNSAEFKSYMLHSRFNNYEPSSFEELELSDPFNYNSGPNLLPKDNSSLLTAGNFDGIFSNPFFEKNNYLGASGKVNWFDGWINFKPLKTNYNFPL